MKVYFKFFYILILLTLGQFFLPKVLAADIFSPWQTTQSLPHAVASSGTYVFNNKLFLVDGATNTTTPGNLYSSIDNNTGLLSSWQLTLITPPDIYWHSLVQKGNYVYLIGGATFPPTTTINTTYIGQTLNDGSVASWDVTSSLPVPLSQAAATVIGDKVYISGGFTQNPNQASDKVYVSTINPIDGTLSAWSEAGVLPKPLSGHGMIAYNNNLYVLGGSDGSSDNLAVYHTTPVNGLISSWIPDSPLLDDAYRASFTIKDNYIFVIGGYNRTNNTATNQVYYSSIQPNNTLSSWATSTHPLPKTVCCGSAAVVGNYLYQLGGYSPLDGYLDNVYMTKLTTDISLHVPLLKQTDPTWKDQLYDTANLWSPSDTTINSWGCAITSAAMIFQYNNITHLPDNLELSPGSLNFWLKSQPDGYVREGWVNWLALSRLSRLAKLSGNNSDFSGDALEYSRISGADKTALTNNLINNFPSILEEPGHFIVAKGTSGNTFAINDPYYARSLLTDGYNDTFLSQGIFTPSHTDLSYMMITGDKNLSFTMHTASLSATSFIQQPLVSDTTSKKAGDPFSLLYFQKPENNTYTMDVSSTIRGLYKLQLYSYDDTGEVKILPITGMIDPGTPQKITVKYDKKNTSTSAQRVITFESTLQDIKDGNSSGLISNQITPGLIQLIKTAQNLSQKKITNPYSKQTLKTFEMVVNKWAGTPALSSKIAPILLEDEAALYSSF